MLAEVHSLLSLQVPPLQDRDSPCNRIGQLQGHEPVVAQGTPDQRPLSKGPQQRHRSHRTEQAQGWLFISPEQPQTTSSQVRWLFT